MMPAMAIGAEWGAKLDPHLRGVDELASRYYQRLYQPKPLHPLEAMRLMHDGAVLGGVPTPMAEDELAFDRIRASAAERDRATLDCWYGHSGSSAQKAKRLGISRTTLYLLWKTALSYFRGHLHGRGFDI
jgi:hypothetical protein